MTISFVDLRDWEWAIAPGRLTAWPTIPAIFWRLLRMAMIPAVITGGLWFSWGPPWGSFMREPDPAGDSSLASHPDFSADVEELRARLREQIGPDRYAEAEAKWEKERLARKVQQRQQDQKIALFSRVARLLYWILWTPLFLWSLWVLVVIAKMPFSRFVIERLPGGRLRIRMPGPLADRVMEFAPGELTGAKAGVFHVVDRRKRFAENHWFVELCRRSARHPSLPAMILTAAAAAPGSVGGEPGPVAAFLHDLEKATGLKKA